MPFLWQTHLMHEQNKYFNSKIFEILFGFMLVSSYPRVRTCTRKKKQQKTSFSRRHQNEKDARL